MTHTTSQVARSPWPHRLAMVLAAATFPLVWVGGLVTTTDAGMAVPDWPNTYGYNLLLYPWQTWVTGPWDVFVEHGHRLLATAVGLITITLLVALWLADRRRWVRGLGIAALILVVLQGVLGGMRVLLDERALAMVHGFIGPLFFALTVAIAVVTSDRWHRGRIGETSRAAPSCVWQLAAITAALFYVQIVLGAILRHVSTASGPAAFTVAVEFHLLLAAVLLANVVALAWLLLRYQKGLLDRLAFAIGGLTVVQIVLGAATWLANYGTPFWLARWTGPGRLTIEAGGWLQTHIVTAHVAAGSLLLGTSVALAIYALRFKASQPAAAPAALAAREVSA